MAQLKSGTRIYGTAGIDTSLTVGSGVTITTTSISATNINVSGITTAATLRATSIVGVTTAGITTAYISSVNNGPISGFKNLIINGGFDIWQRGTSFSTNVAYTADRWWLVNDSVGTATVTRQDISSQGLGSQYCLRAERSSGTNRWTIGTQLETSTVKSVLGKTINLSFYIRKGTALTSNVVTTLATSATEEKFGTQIETANLTISNSGMSTTSFTKYSTSLNVGAASTALGIKIEFEANQAGASNAYFEIAQVQLEEGPVASVFERRPYGQELALCQRYYYRVDAVDYGGGGPIFGSGTNNSTTVSMIWTPFAVPMRTSPSSIDTTGTASNYAVIHTTTSVTCSSVPVIDDRNRYGCRTNLTVASGLTAGQGSFGRLATTGTSYIGFNAEL